MTKWLFRILRILFAAGGLLIIVVMIDFQDMVVVPDKTILDDGTTTEGPTHLAVLAGDLSGQAGDVTLLIRYSDSGPVTHIFAASGLGVGETDFQPRPGIITMLRGCDPALLVAGLFMVLPAYLIGAVRWWLLMRCRRLEVSVWRTIRLAWVGNFFNFCMPGTTGGDLVKAYYAAKRSDRRADTLVSIVVDRVTGLVGLLVLASVAGLFMWRDPVVARVTTILGLGAVGLAVAALVYFTPPLRRRLGFDWVLARLPGRRLFKSIDEAAVAYRHHKVVVAVAVGMSVGVHACLATATGLAGYALGVGTALGVLLNIVPILFLAGAVPLTYQGLGVMEWLATTMILDPPATTANQVVGMLLLVRLFQVVWAMLGSVFLLKGDIHMHPPKESDEATERRSDEGMGAEA